MEQTLYDRYGEKDATITYAYNDKNEIVSFVSTDDNNDTLQTQELILSEKKDKHLFISTLDLLW